jgi:hypothetical protein
MEVEGDDPGRGEGQVEGGGGQERVMG